MYKRLKTFFLGKELCSPLVLPAGVLGISFSSLKNSIDYGAGIVTSKSLTLKPREGHKGPVVAEFEGGLLNSMGLCNPGIAEGLSGIKEYKSVCSSPVIVSIFGSNPEEFKELTLYVNDSEADFLELNLSCPNVLDEFGIPLSASAGKVFEIVQGVKQISKLPVIAKLSPNIYSIKEIALSAEKAGADALSLINTVGPGMLIDIESKTPVLNNVFGGLSGPCIKPIALKLIYETYSVVKIPIIGMGGVKNGRDAVEMLMAGSTLIGAGTAVIYRGADVFKKICGEMEDFMREKGYSSILEIEKLEKLHG